jgi:transcription elongation factor Elf1
MEEIELNCPKCGAKESVSLEKRTIATTYVPIGKEDDKYYTCLSQDFERYSDGHIPVSNWYEQYIFSCCYCSFEVVYREEDSFSEYDEEISEDDLRKFGFIK